MLIQFGIVVVVILYSAPTGLEGLGKVAYRCGVLRTGHDVGDGGGSIESLMVCRTWFSRAFYFCMYLLFAVYSTPVVSTDASWRLGKLGLPDVKHGEKGD